MNVQPLEKNVISQLRSSCNINSISQCVIELVHNSLDAKSTAIAIRINLTNFRIQIVDNGNGISRTNLEQLGQQYMTNKCHNLSDLRRYLKYYGYRGEALWSISKLSKCVKITTREKHTNDTFTKIIEKHSKRVEIDKSRPSCGTTVTIDDFLYNLPVRQKSIKFNEFDTIKKHLESLIIIHPQVSFSLRDDSNGNLLLNSCTAASIIESFHNLYPDINNDGFNLIKISKERTSIKGLLHRDFYNKKTMQFIYVNKRPINCSKIRNFIGTLFKKQQFCVDKQRKYPIFIIMIKLPYTEVDFQLEPSKMSVLFRNFDLIKYCLEKLICNFYGSDHSGITQTFNHNFNKDYGLSQFVGAVKACGSKRKFNDSNDSRLSNGKMLRDEGGLNIQNSERVTLPLEAHPFPEEDQPHSFIDNNDNQQIGDVDGNVGNNMTLFTNHPENEEKGKNLIMNMFIKSTQVYPENFNESTIQNDSKLASNSSGNKRWSESNKVSLGIQTSLQNELVSIGIQATPNDLILTETNSISPKLNHENSLENTQTLKQISNDIPIFTTEMTRNLFEFTDNSVKTNDQQFRFSQKSNSFRKEKDDSNIFTFPSISKNTEIIYNRHKLERGSNSITTLDNIQLSPISKSLKSPYFQSSKSMNDGEIKQEISEKCNFLRSKSDNSHNLIAHQTKDCLNETVRSKYFLPNETTNNSQLLNLFETIDPFLESQKKDANFEEQQSNQIWTKEVNNFGTTIYVNQATGAISLCSPKSEPTCQMTKRLECVPKGLSPILKDIGPIDNMTPNSKEKLQNAVVAACETELLTVKWQKYLDDDKDIKDFLAGIYAEKSKLIENTIPNIHKSNLSKNVVKSLKNLSFTKELFGNVKVIGQLDCKFIVTLDKTKNLLVLFDQHAVHERVRVELLWQGYKNSSFKIERGITFFLPRNNLDLLRNQIENLKSLGFMFNDFSDGIVVTQVPQCLYNKSLKEANLSELIELFLKEIIENLNDNNGLLISVPKMLENIVNLEACRGAIKFGDPLTKNECNQLLQDLSQCALPFQCAHGRPTLTPLLFLQKQFMKMEINKPNLKILN